MTRINFAKRIGFALVLGHIIVSLEIVVLHFATGLDHVLELLKISAPVTVAYATPVMGWFGDMAESDAPASRKRMDRIEGRLYWCITVLFLACLAAVPAMLAYSGSGVDPTQATTYFAGIEFIFGAIMATMMKTLFGRR